MSTHCCPVVPVVLEKHPNADSLSIVRIGGEGGYTVVVKTTDWEAEKLAVYVPPDYIVPDLPYFSFLEGKRRITVRRFRGVLSEGMLVPFKAFTVDGLALAVADGDNAFEACGFERYEPPAPRESRPGGPPAPSAPAPEVTGAFTKYDLEALKAHPGGFLEDERVLVTEKIHGSNIRLVWQDGRLHVGSRTRWTDRVEDNRFWKGVESTPGLLDWLQAHPDRIWYGEVYGASVQGPKFKYDAPDGEVRVRLFSSKEFHSFDPLHLWVPELARGRWGDIKQILDTMIGWPSAIAGQGLKEGVVIESLDKDYFFDKRLNRIPAKLKAINPDYYLKG